MKKKCKKVQRKLVWAYGDFDGWVWKQDDTRLFANAETFIWSNSAPQAPPPGKLIPGRWVRVKLVEVKASKAKA